MIQKRRLRRSHDPHRLAFLVAATVAAELCRVPLDDVLMRVTAGTGRSKRVRRARHLAVYLTHTAGNLTIAETARAAGRFRQRVSTHCHQVEDMRDDPRFDAFVLRAETWFAQRFGLLSAGLPT